MLRYRYRPRHRRLSSALGPCSGPAGRIKSLQKTVTEIFRSERIEANYGRCDEARGYVERLIQEAIKHGDKHRATMEMADFWLLEKDLIHKLFKVFVPRYQSYTTSFTSVRNLPTVYPGTGIERAILELKGNPWPPVVPVRRQRDNFLSNILLTEAQKEYRQEKYAEQAQKMSSAAWVECQEPLEGDNSVSQTVLGAENHGSPIDSDVDLRNEQEFQKTDGGVK